MELYCVHGFFVPEDWAKTPADQWKAKWLLDANNAEYRMVLLRVLGYVKVLAELDSIVLDEGIDTNNNEMMLIKIGGYDVEDICLLKVVCPSTGKIHILRVPPSMRYCEEARRWTLFDIYNQYNITFRNLNQIFKSNTKVIL